MLMLLPLTVTAQQAQRVKPAERTDRARLEAILQRETMRSREASVRLDEALSKRDAPRVYADSLIARREWIGLLEDRPVFRITHNREAAATSRINTLLDGGRTGLSLSGQGQTALLIDSGHPRQTHVELAGRVDKRDQFSTEQSHATHVAGTIAGGGVWREALGMAPAALIRSHDWTNDVAEMAQAALDGIRVSNHSYGDPLGWTPNVLGDGYWGWMGRPSISTVEDVQFGRYGETAAAWDEVAHASMHLLIVKSAGNERERQGPPDGAPHWVFDGGWTVSTAIRNQDGGLDGYDTIGDAGVAKNVLTVGAVEDAPWGVESPEDVVMTPFSGWGPVDDGRIKPDLVANGTSLISAKAGADDAYGPSTGTSQAAPVVTGAALLIEELWDREYPGTVPLSSTIRALLIHSADEAGSSEGPDYRFGWGLLNAERAALHLKQSADADRIFAPVRPYPVWIFEGELAAGETRTFDLPISDAMALRATLAWVDPAASIGPAALDDRSPRLVHDLDLQIMQNGSVHLPWVLDPARPEAAASRGVNIRDNVEQIVFDAGSGTVQIRVSAPASLTTASQPFSLIVGTPVAASPATALTSVSGAVRLGNTPLADINIRATGPVLRGSTTGNDGIFLIDDLPPGTYTISADPSRFQIAPEPFEITLPQDAGRYDFAASSTVRTLTPRVFTSSRLLQSGEQGVAQDVSTVRAGGLYGVELFFRNDGAESLSGSSVVLDTEFDPFLAPWSGVESDRLAALSMQQRLGTTEDGRLRFRIPVVWVDGEAPDGTLLQLPYEIRLGQPTGGLVHADTLTLEVAGRDLQAPMALASVRSPGISWAPVGEDLEVRAGFLDGSPLRRATASLVDRFDTTRVLASFPLRDSGDLAGDLDFVEGDGIHSARFYPDIEADYQLRVEAEDIHGNTSRTLLPAWYTSAPFEGGGSLLFLAWDDTGSRTNAHLAMLEELGERPSWWESFVRGPIPSSDVSGFERMWVGRLSRPLERETELAAVRDHVAGGGSLHLFGQRPVAGEQAEDWLAATSGIRIGDVVPADSIRGVGPLRGIYLRPNGSAPPRALDIPPTAEPLLMDGDAVLAARSGSVVVSTVGVGSLLTDDADRMLLRAFLYEESGTLTDLRAPDLVVPRPDTLLQAYTDSIRVQWELQPWATYRVQVSTDSVFADANQLAFEVETDASGVRVGPLTRGAAYFWRVEARNPAGSSGWNVPRRFNAREANVAPTALLTEDSLVTGVRRNRSYLSWQRYFADDNGDRLTFSAQVDSTHIVAAEVVTTGLWIEPLAVGEAVITVRATDPEGLHAELPIRVEVRENQAPAAPGWPANPQYMKPASERRWAIEDIFVEPDDDLLRFWVYNERPSVAEARIEDGELIIESREPGIGYLALEVHDGRGASIFQSLLIRVRSNTPPRRDVRVPDPEFFPGDTLALPLSVFVVDDEQDAVRFELTATSDAVLDARVQGDSLFARLDPALSASDVPSVTLRAYDVYEESISFTLPLQINPAAVFRREDSTIPERFEAGPSYPQPFRQRVVLPFTLPAPARVRLDVYDSLGRHAATVADRTLQAGSHRIEWSPPSGLPGGNYYYQLRAGQRVRRGILVYVP